MASESPDMDGQDKAEAFDEDNLNLDEAGAPPTEMRTFEELPELRDETSAVGDADDDDALIGEDLDDDEIIALEADEVLADPEDDDLERRMQEPTKLAAEGGGASDETLTEDQLRERQAAAKRAG